jgi:peptidyl-Asp metalloendopeptidase
MRKSSKLPNSVHRFLSRWIFIIVTGSVLLPLQAFPPPLPTSEESFALKVEQDFKRIIGEEIFLDAPIQPLSIPIEGLKRYRVVGINNSIVLKSSEKIILNFFDDVSFTGFFEKEEVIGNARVRKYKLSEVEGGFFLLAVQQGNLEGFCFLPGRDSFGFQHFQGSYLAYEQIAGSEHACKADEIRSDLEKDPRSTETFFSEEAEYQTSFAEGSFSQTGSVIDILIFYTPAVRDNLNGKEKIETRISLDLALANQILENSFPNSAPPRLRLVHLDEINYTEDDDERKNLTWLTLNSDVNSLRDRFGADLVSMYISKSRSVAWMLRQNPAGYWDEGTFSTVIPGISVSTTLAHEIGHNLGCGHNRADQTSSPYFSYSYGHTFNYDGITLGTVMSYTHQIMSFSNPDVYYNGIPTGVPIGQTGEANNAATISHTSPIVASSRVATELTAPSWSGSTFNFVVTGPDQEQFVIEHSSDLISWSLLSAGTNTITGGVSSVSDFGSGNVITRFYRAKPGTVYSLNSLGFIKLNIKSGYSMVANHLETGNNTVGALFPNPPAGTTIYKWDEQNDQYIVNNFTFGQWSIPGMSMNPGEGVIIENPGAAFVVNLVGEVKQGYLSNSVPDGFAIRSSLLPVGGGVVSSLGFPMANDERIHRMTNTNGTYTIYYHFGTSPSGFWSPNPPGEPAPSTGEAFWSEKHNSQDWIRNFWIWQ